MRSERLRWLAKAKGPFASIYFDDTHDTPDAAERLEATWGDIRRNLENLGAGPEVIGKLEEAVLHHRPAVGRRGRAVITTDDEVLVNEELSSPPPYAVVRFSDYPYILPLVRLEIRRPTYVVTTVHRTGADVSLYRGQTINSTCIDGGGFPVHKPASAGWNGYGDLQHTTDEALRMNYRAVADHLTRLVDDADPEVVFVCGEARSRAGLLAELPERVHQRVSQLHVGARPSGIDPEELREMTAAELDRRQGSELTTIAGRYEAETGRRSGLAAEGMAAVCAALRDGDVDTLIIGELGDATVVTGATRTVFAPDADALSELGEPVDRVARADEVLPFAAIAIGAAVVLADGRIAPADGIGALLRYAAPDRLAGQQS
ncbi:hypothetical protein [Mycobacterium shigaense]|uniref:Rv2629 family ribosome hibernation factor n=1 Tax=Mycobacterium shigaense TaxID=722731 RepID=UPI000E58BF30|nr:hypothetical protein [Mycobacterium shigaense]